MCLGRKKKDKSRVLSGGICVRDSEAEQREQRHYKSCIFIAQLQTVTLQLLNQINKIRETRTLDLPFFFCYKHPASLRNLPSAAPSESQPYWFQGNFAAVFVLNYWLREFLLSAFANRFELRCEPKQLIVLYYKICPCSFRR